MPRNKLINLYLNLKTILAWFIEEETDTERFPELSKVTQIVSGRCGIWNQTAWLWSLGSKQFLVRKAFEPKRTTFCFVKILAELLELANFLQGKAALRMSRGKWGYRSLPVWDVYLLYSRM